MFTFSILIAGKLASLTSLSILLYRYKMTKNITCYMTLPVEQPSQREKFFAAFAAITLCVFGIVGNFNKIVTLRWCQTSRTVPSNLLILSLSTSDFLFCLLNLPPLGASFIYYNDGGVVQEWLQETELCRWIPFFFYGNCATSMVNLVAISINRYIMICGMDYTRLQSIKA